MPRFRVYVVGTANYLSIEHDASTADDLFSLGRSDGFIRAVALETNGDRRRVLIPFDKIALLTEGADTDTRRVKSRTISSRPIARKLS